MAVLSKRASARYETKECIHRGNSDQRKLGHLDGVVSYFLILWHRSCHMGSFHGEKVSDEAYLALIGTLRANL
jgi:hypothetical protein